MAVGISALPASGGVARGGYGVFHVGFRGRCMEEVWIAIVVDISGRVILVVVSEDGLLPVFAYGMR